MRKFWQLNTERQMNSYRNLQENDKVIRYILEHKIHWYTFTSMCFVYVWFSKPVLNLFDRMLLPLASSFKSDIPSYIILVLLCACVGFDLYRKSKYNYQYNRLLIFCLLWIIIMFGYYRTTDRYAYVNLFWYINYIDILIFIGIGYIISAVINFVRWIIRQQNKQQQNVNKSFMLLDWPIEKEDEDIFDLKDEAKKIAQEIKDLDRRKTWSLAINAPWGTGKTSFLNMIVGILNKENLEVIIFNPRNSKSYQSIQEDFFTMVASALAKYDSRCSNVFKDYMTSLQLIDNRGIVEKILKIYHIWDKKGLKNKIKEVFCELDKKVVVIIDDFDRLSKEEVFEVLKLIDSNAAFTNLVFLTAYDKNQVNRSLGLENQTDDAFFVDKFFNLEFSIPSRPYSYIREYLIDNIVAILKAKNSEKKEFQDAINRRSDFMQSYLPTLRDAKRYINQVIMDYKEVRGDVNVDEFLLVHLIKYKYIDEYKRLYWQEFVWSSPLPNSDILCLKQKLDTNLSILPILKCLFPQEGSSKKNSSYRHIYDKQSFNNYFVNQIYSALRIGDMEKIFHGDIVTVYSKVSNWLADDLKIKDLIDYLSSLGMDNFINGDKYSRYVDIITYIAVHKPQSYAYWLFMRLIYASNLDGYDKKYDLNIDNYKAQILAILSNKEYDKSLSLLRGLHVNYKTGKIDEDQNIIKDSDIWLIVKEQFKTIIDDSSISEEEKRDYLYNCIDHLELPSRRVILDIDCCQLYCEHIKNEPSFYIGNFVRLLAQSTSPEWNSITCEPFCNQIFEGEVNVEAYIDQCLKNGVNGADTASNFWKLYTANDYKPIEFNHQGNVQEKINNGLKEELLMLEQLQAIQKEISSLPKDLSELEDEQKNNSILSPHQMLEKLEEIKLYISLNAQLRNQIKELQKQYSEQLEVQ